MYLGPCTATSKLNKFEHAGAGVAGRQRQWRGRACVEGGGAGVPIW